MNFIQIVLTNGYVIKKFVNDVRDAMDANIKFTDYGPKAGIGSKYEKRSTAGPVATAGAGTTALNLLCPPDR